MTEGMATKPEGFQGDPTTWAYKDGVRAARASEYRDSNPCDPDRENLRWLNWLAGFDAATTPTKPEGLPEGMVEALVTRPEASTMERLAQVIQGSNLKPTKRFLSAAFLGYELAKHELAYTPTKAATAEGQGEGPFGYWVEQKHADPVLLRKPAYIPEPNERRTVTPLYAAPSRAEQILHRIAVLVNAGKIEGLTSDAVEALESADLAALANLPGGCDAS
ncbi:hypothetical protein [Sphingomonas xinjiangensis]|uniref:Uncharacterized protein n=1 Tax=Sphingomonas xinjiangensis TaxID=643568 RepID=A0A840YNW3_9SPHN|nr:hypothetical protein [Sphingomonas xinjiangensis]MBB5709302.1 hypothetical protein [Sphingomonas xinjiangensis]